MLALHGPIRNCHDSLSSFFLLLARLLVLLSSSLPPPLPSVAAEMETFNCSPHGAALRIVIAMRTEARPFNQF